MSKPLISIVGLGCQYPPHSLDATDLQIFVKRSGIHDSDVLRKVMAINSRTGIERRSAVLPLDHWVHTQNEPVDINVLHTIFLEHGVPLAVQACKKAIDEWGGDVSDITHVVCSTCSDSANPGFDHALIAGLGISANMEKILLAGVGCSGGLATLRVAAQMALARWAQGLPARILCVALEVTSTLLRAELDQLTPTGEVGIGVCLFGDGAGAAVVSNCIVQKPGGRTHGLFDIVEWRHELVPDSTDALTYHVNAKGWRAVLTPEIPKFVIRHVKGVFDALMDEGSSTDDKVIHHTPDAHSFDWALHPGGRAIIDGVEEALGLHPDRLRASRHIYKNFGNASSATNLTVLDKLREIHEGGRDVIALAFGPGIVVEMLLLHRP